MSIVSFDGLEIAMKRELAQPVNIPTGRSATGNKTLTTRELAHVQFEISHSLGTLRAYIAMLTLASQPTHHGTMDVLSTAHLLRYSSVISLAADNSSKAFGQLW
jgi:hypothetical protein